MKKIAVLTSGGDAPGMNAAIRGVVRTALSKGLQVYGISRGWEGLITDQVEELNSHSVSDIIQRGGTFLKTARCPEFMHKEGRAKAAQTLKKYGIEGVVVIGGDGSFRGAKLLYEEHGIKCMGIPGTIDNDLAYTDFTLGFDTAVNTVLGAINNLRDTMQSHDRVSLVEVMGRHCGDIALYAGIAGGAECILVPEKSYDLEEIANMLDLGQKIGKTSNMIVMAEGVGDKEEIISFLENKANVDVKITHLGHVQRGGSPTMSDRILATRMAVKAVELMVDESTGASAIGIKGNKIFSVPFEQVFTAKKRFDDELYEDAEVLSK